MKLSSVATDKVAISLSMLCLLHCLAVPLLIAVVPSVAAMAFTDESFHLWLVLAVFPTSIYALTMGCKRHKQKKVVMLGGIGLTLLVLALVLGSIFHNEVIEKTLTAMGTLLIGFSHFQNFKLCQKTSCDDAACS